MAFLSWLEATALSDWILTSLVGWPIMLSLHAIGLAIVVGIVFALDLRILGLYTQITFESLFALLSIAWIGVTMNLITGLALFGAQATTYVTSLPFIVKITFIILGSINLYYTQKVVKRDAAAWEAAGAVPRNGLWLASTSILFWAVAIVTGRLIAYL